MKKKNFFIASMLLSMVLTTLSCNKSSSYGGNGNGNGGGTTTSNDISMYNMTFSPASKTVAIGTTVKWVNNDAFAHTVTSNDGSTFNSGTVNGGGTYSYTATVAGTYPYHCTIHGTAMSGTLIVTP